MPTTKKQVPDPGRKTKTANAVSKKQTVAAKKSKKKITGPILPVMPLLEI